MNILRKTRESIFTSKSIIENKDSKNGKKCLDINMWKT